MTRSELVVALDHPSFQKACEVIDTLDSEVLWYKVGASLFVQHGPEIVRYLHDKRKKIFVDLKLHDTPNVTANTVTQLAEMGVSLTTIHCMGGKKMLEAAAAACRGSELGLVGVTLLTSTSAEEISIGGPHSTSSLVSSLAKIASQTRLRGVMCSSHELLDLKTHLEADIRQGFLRIVAGLRWGGVSVFNDDQLRTSSPEEAAARGADFLVIGRPITDSPDPRKVVQSLFIPV